MVLVQAFFCYTCKLVTSCPWKFWVRNEKDVSLKTIWLASVKFWHIGLPGMHCISLVRQYLSNLLQSCWFNAAKMKKRTSSKRCYIKCSIKPSMQYKTSLQLSHACVSTCKFSVLLVIAFKCFSDKLVVAQSFLSSSFLWVSSIKPSSKNPLMLGKTQEQFQLSNYCKDLPWKPQMSQGTMSAPSYFPWKKSITIITTGCKYIRLCLNVKYVYLSTDIPFEILLSLQLSIGHNSCKVMRHLIMILEWIWYNNAFIVKNIYE